MASKKDNGKNPNTLKIVLLILVILLLLGAGFGFGFGKFGGEDINEFEHVFYADHPMEMTVLFEEE